MNETIIRPMTSQRRAEIDEGFENAKTIDAKPIVHAHKTGRWIFVDKAHEHGRCSECDYGNVDLVDGRPYNYCPNCGAKIESEEK